MLTMEFSPKIEDFYGVYLLCSQSTEPRYRNRVYIGFTVNPNRRINQHNRGKDFGGAKKTSNKGPWKMVMIIHGFPNNISALQFEWAWQSPKVSSRLKNLPNLNRKRNESYFEYNFRILSEMLRIGPWNRMPLVIRWLAPDYVRDFLPDKVPPLHMQICHGQVSIKKKSKANDEEALTICASQLTNQTSQTYASECHLCMKTIENAVRSKITCMNPRCSFRCHIVCLATVCLEPGQYVPIEGDCPLCETHFLWGDLIRKKRGCNDLEESAFSDDDDVGYHFDDEVNISIESQAYDDSDDAF